METKGQPAIWAIDPGQTYRAEPGALRKLAHYLGSFSNLEGVYIQGAKEPLDNPEQKLRGYIDSFEASQVSSSQVLKIPSDSLGLWIETLIDHAYKKWASCIVVTHLPKKGSEKLAFGGFVKRLLQRSPLPLVFLSHDNGILQVNKKVLFATDFSEESHKAFKEFLRFVDKSADEVLLYHSIEVAAPNTAMEWTESPIFLTEAFRSGVNQWVMGQSAQWIQEAKEMSPHLQIRPILQETTSGPSVNIERIADKEKVDLIGVASKVGPAERLFVGSVAQDLIKSSKYLLWVCGPTFYETHL